MQSIFEFDAVTYHWQDGKGVENISFVAEAGKVVLITGASGAGKSTLLRLAARLEEPQSGEIRFMGRPLRDYSPQNLRRNVSFVQQNPVLVQGTVRDNLLLPFSFEVNSQAVVPSDAKLESWLERLVLAGVGLDDDAKSCSVGQRQRLCVIRSLLLEPQCICMDEPTSALDNESRRIVEDVINTLAEQGTAVLLVSHSDFRPAAPYTHVVMQNGTISCESHTGNCPLPEDVLNEPSTMKGQMNDSSGT